MKLNKSKCELITVSGEAKVKFRDGSFVPCKDEARYLGCVLNHRADPRREVKLRISQCMITWKRLGVFFKQGASFMKDKLLIWDSVFRSKLLHGLESLHSTDALKKQLDAFQLKGLRQILKITTTCVD